MKQCKRCGMQAADNIEVCERCGGVEFVYNTVPRTANNSGQPVRPQGQPVRPQGQPVRPQGMPNRPNMNQRGPMPNGQMPNGQMPNGQMHQMPNGQANQFNQTARPQMNQPNQNGFNQYGQANNTQNNPFGQNGMTNGMNGQYMQNQQYGPVNSTDAFGNEVNFDPNAGAQQPKKGLFGKGKKADKQPKKQANMGEQNNNPFENNNFTMGMTAEDTGNTQAQQVMPGTFGVITVKRWLILWLQMCIPIWGIIVIVKTLTNSHEDPSIKNFIKAYLVMMCLGAVLGLLSFVMLNSLLL